MEAEERDITIGPGKLLGLFFLLVAICGVFFAIGYSLGKSSAREQALNDRPAETGAVTTSGDAGANKPSPATAAKSDPVPVAADSTAAKGVDPDLTFYKTVKQNGQDGGT